MRRAWPHALFAAITLLAVLRPGTLFDTTLLHVRTGGLPPKGWQERGDTLLLLPMHLRLAAEGALWNPHLFAGHPAHADPMAHPFYPPRMVLYRLLPLRAAYAAELGLHLFFAGTALYSLLRALERSRPAATAGALLWMLWGYHAHWFTTTILLGASVFGPLALLGVARGRPALGGAAMGLAILGTHPQHALFFFLLGLVWTAATAGPRPAVLFAVFSVGAGLAAILARLDVLGSGFRAAGLDYAAVYERPGDLLRALARIPFGGLVPEIESPVARSELAAHLGLAGLALAAVACFRRRGDRRIRVLAGAGVLALLVAFVPVLAKAALSIPLLNLSLPSRWICVFGFCVALLAGFGWDALPLRRPAAAAAVLGLILLQLLPPFLAHNRPADPAPLEQRLDLPDRVASVPGATAWETATADNLLALLGARTIGGYEAIAPLRFARWFDAAGGQVAGSGRVFALERFDSPLLDRASVTAVVDLEGRSVRRPAALPRARVEGSIVPASSADDAAALLNLGLPVVEGGTRIGSPGSVRWVVDSPDEIVLDVEADAPAWLVLADGYDEGWTATVGDREASIHPADLAFRAVEVPGGSSRVVFRYRPSAAALGFPLSLLFLLAGSGILSLDRRWRACEGRRA